jgi:signal transduction histidine kinase
MPHTNSLKIRLVTHLVSMIAVIFMAIAISGAFAIRHQTERLLDSHLSQIAYVLMEINFEKIENYDATAPHNILPLLRLSSKDGVQYQIWRGSKLVVSSTEAPKEKLNTPVGFSEELIDGEVYRMLHLTLSGEDEIEIYVFADSDIKSGLVGPFTGVLSAHFLAEILSILAIIWLGVSRGLAPLNTIASRIERMQHNDLSPIAEESAPREISPIIRALNNLFRMLRDSFDAERQFNSHAAHELRTPLAALKVQIQVAQREKDPQALQKHLKAILLGADRAAHVVNQLLDMARLDPVGGNFDKEEMLLTEAAREAFQDIAPEAENHDINISLCVVSERQIIGNKQTLAILIRNLLRNAVQYSPKGTDVTVTIKDDGEHQSISIADQGLGIPENLREKIFDRFYRIPGTEKTGVGLGLFIVKKIAEIHGANISVDSAGGRGSCFLVKFSSIKN